MSTLDLFSEAPLQDMWQTKPERCRRLLELFLSELTPQTAKLNALLELGDSAAIGRLAHSLKSSARQVGALQLGEAAFEIEIAARDNAAFMHLSNLVYRLQQVVPPTVNALQTKLKD